MTNELAIASSAMTIEQVVEQRELVKSAMKNAMMEGQHYGKIPGCGEKPTLMQPGAQLLGHLFKVRPDYEIKEVNFEAEHREYQVRCRLFHMGSGIEVGQGVGICSTRESKYRYRNAAKEVTWLDEPVPKVYWNLRNDSAKLKEWLETVFDGKDVSHIGVKKNESQQWMFVEYHGGEGKVENENIADVFNTVLKMAKKRAYVDSIITATASSDLFTQDLEEIAENLRAVQEVNATTIKADAVEKNVTPPDEGKAKNLDGPKATAKATAEPVGRDQYSSQTTPPPSTPSPTTGWQDVICHIGKPQGPIKDKPLGKLATSSMEWLEAQMGKKEKPTKQDNQLKAALAIWRGSQASGNLPLGSPNRDMLRAKCEAMKIPLDQVAEAARTLGGSAKTFDEIPDDEAKHLLTGWTETLGIIRDNHDGVPQ